MSCLFVQLAFYHFINKKKTFECTSQSYYSKSRRHASGLTTNAGNWKTFIHPIAQNTTFCGKFASFILLIGQRMHLEKSDECHCGVKLVNMLTDFKQWMKHFALPFSLRLVQATKDTQTWSKWIWHNTEGYLEGRCKQSGGHRQRHGSCKGLMDDGAVSILIIIMVFAIIGGHRETGLDIQSPVSCFCLCLRYDKQSCPPDLSCPANAKCLHL